MSHNKEAWRVPLINSLGKTDFTIHAHSDPPFPMEQQQQQQQQQQQHAKVERFLKLGYSYVDIRRVLESLHHDAQTNDILEELIKTCQTPSHPDRSQVPNSAKLVPRGCSPGPPLPRPGADGREAAAAFRPVVIDGSNVAMSHGDTKVFSCQGLQLAVNWFWDKGLRDITVFVPLWRKEQPRPEAAITDQHILHELERRKILVYTPSRCVNGKRVVCYDDRYIIKLAFDSDGIIVSNDNYRDLQTENPQWKRFIEERLLMYSFANDKFMPPYDPLGRNGPTIDDFLRKKPRPSDNKLQHCPYGKKCTYGVKCKFYHPERFNQSQLSVADELRALRDKAKNWLPDAHFCPLNQPERGYGSSSPPPPPPSAELPVEHSLCGRDSGSPRGLRHCPSPDTDEAFGSMESSLSRLYIQDGPYSREPSPCSYSREPSPCSYSREPSPCSYSSGVASCSLGYDDLSGSYSSGGGGHRSGPCQTHQSCSLSCVPVGCHCKWGHQQGPMSAQPQQPAWTSCPALPPHRGEYSKERQYVMQLPGRQTRALFTEPWGPGGGFSENQVGNWEQGESSAQRKALRIQLSTLFPQSSVEQVMNHYPDISDMSKLIPLIQSYRTSHLSV